MRYWLNEKTEQKADSYASHSIDSADWCKTFKTGEISIGICEGNEI